MAHLSREATADRGQIILVAAVVLAVTFVGLALVVNSAIFSENLATRGDVPGSGEALDYRYEVEQGVGEIVETVNANESAGPAEIENSVGNISSQSGFQQARSGRVVNVSYVSDVDGNRLAQDNPGVLTTGGQRLLASDVDRTRNVKFNFTKVDDDFELIVENGTGYFWNMTVDPNPSGDAEIKINRSGVSGLPSCTVDSTTPTIDVTGATVNGERCQALERKGEGEPLWFGAGISSDYEIRFEATGGDTVNGTYSMIVDESILDFDPNEFDNIDSDIVYSTTVRLDYRTSNVRYETEIEVAPGEVPP